MKREGVRALRHVRESGLPQTFVGILSRGYPRHRVRTFELNVPKREILAFENTKFGDRCLSPRLRDAASEERLRSPLGEEIVWPLPAPIGLDAEVRVALHVADRLHENRPVLLDLADEIANARLDGGDRILPPDPHDVVGSEGKIVNTTVLRRPDLATMCRPPTTILPFVKEGRVDREWKHLSRVDRERVWVSLMVAVAVDVVEAVDDRQHSEAVFLWIVLEPFHLQFMLPEEIRLRLAAQGRHDDGVLERLLVRIAIGRIVALRAIDVAAEVDDHRVTKLARLELCECRGVDSRRLGMGVLLRAAKHFVEFTSRWPVAVREDEEVRAAGTFAGVDARVSDERIPPRVITHAGVKARMDDVFHRSNPSPFAGERIRQVELWLVTMFMMECHGACLLVHFVLRF